MAKLQYLIFQSLQDTKNMRDEKISSAVQEASLRGYKTPALHAYRDALQQVPLDINLHPHKILKDVTRPFLRQFKPEPTKQRKYLERK